METNLDHGIEWIYGTLRLCMVNILSPKLGFWIKLYLNLGFLKIGLVKPHMVQDNHRILSFGLDSWLI